MKNIFIKPIVITTALLTFITGCVKEDDFAIPTVKPILFTQNFETVGVGASSNIEIPIDLDGFTNVNTTGTRLFAGKSRDYNLYAEFSSFYSASNSVDNVWLITPSINMDNTQNEVFRLRYKLGKYNGSVASILVSQDYDGSGTIAAINNATWTNLNVLFPTFDTANFPEKFSSIKPIDFSSYTGNIHVAIRYTGSKSGGPTSTFQLDDIKIYEN